MFHHQVMKQVHMADQATLPIELRSFAGFGYWLQSTSPCSFIEKAKYVLRLFGLSKQKQTKTNKNKDKKPAKQRPASKQVRSSSARSKPRISRKTTCLRESLNNQLALLHCSNSGESSCATSLQNSEQAERAICDSQLIDMRLEILLHLHWIWNGSR